MFCFALFWFAMSQFYPYPSKQLYWYISNHTIFPVLVQQLWRIWINASHDSTRSDNIIISQEGKNGHVPPAQLQWMQSSKKWSWFGHANWQKYMYTWDMRPSVPCCIQEWVHSEFDSSWYIMIYQLYICDVYFILLFTKCSQCPR